MHRKKFLPTLAIVTFVATPVTCVAAARYNVALSLSHKGEVFASPALTIDDGVPATIKVSGEHGYVITITVTSSGVDHIMVATRINSEFGSVDPSMLVNPGEDASALIGDLGITVNARQTGI